jgi:hypothetical protein
VARDDDARSNSRPKVPGHAADCIVGGRVADKIAATLSSSVFHPWTATGWDRLQLPPTTAFSDRGGPQTAGFSQQQALLSLMCVNLGGGEMPFAKLREELRSMLKEEMKVVNIISSSQSLPSPLTNSDSAKVVSQDTLFSSKSFFERFLQTIGLITRVHACSCGTIGT